MGRCLLGPDWPDARHFLPKGTFRACRKQCNSASLGSTDIAFPIFHSIFTHSFHGIVSSRSLSSFLRTSSGVHHEGGGCFGSYRVEVQLQGPVEQSGSVLSAGLEDMYWYLRGLNQPIYIPSDFYRHHGRRGMAGSLCSLAVEKSCTRGVRHGSLPNERSLTGRSIRSSCVSLDLRRQLYWGWFQSCTSSNKTGMSIMLSYISLANGTRSHCKYLPPQCPKATCCLIMPGDLSARIHCEKRRSFPYIGVGCD